MPTRLLFLAAALIAGADSLSAQTPSGPAPGPAGPAKPALAPLPPARPDPARVTPYHQSLRMVMARNGQEQEIGRLDDEVKLTELDGKTAIIRVQNVESPTGQMTDTAVADPNNLAPRWHSSHAEHRTLRLQFGQRRVTGTYKDAGDPSFEINQPVGDTLFDSNMLDVLISALPLAEGYKGRLTVYLYEAGGPTPVDVAVTGSDKVGDVDTWNTGVTIAGRTARYFVGKADRHVVQIVSSPGPGVELRLVRSGE
jgi:hypothetical protein